MTSNLLASQTAVLGQDYHLFFPAGGMSQSTSASRSSRREGSTGVCKLLPPSGDATTDGPSGLPRLGRVPRTTLSPIFRMFDLFSGTRSASQPFSARGWHVETVDILDGEDVRDWYPDGNYDFGWASPPCEG